MSEFTSIDDKLPTNDGEYLVSILVGKFNLVRSYDIAWYDVESMRFMSSRLIGVDGDFALNVTHWAVLPKVEE